MVQTRSVALTAVLALMVIAEDSRGQTTVDGTDKYSYGANIGWINWQGDVTNGARFTDNFASGFIWSANVGWINLGDGSPTNGTNYSNTSADDFGVNVDPNSGVNAFFLAGKAYAANIGWINFDVLPQTGASDRPRIVKATGIMRGFAYSANAGWISLNSEPLAQVQTGLIGAGTPTPSATPTDTPTPSATPTPSPTPFDDAGVSGFVPPQIAANHLTPVQINFFNAGNTAWSTAGGYFVSVITDSCGLLGVPRLELNGSATTAPGETLTLRLLLQAGATTGDCALELRMAQETAGAFGGSFAASTTIVEAQNDAVFVSNNIPATIAPNLSFGVGITVRNTGNTTWSPDGNYALAVPSDSCGLSAINRIPLTPASSVLPNQTWQFIAQITAPPDAGPCNLSLRMVEEGVEFFGPTLTLTINVEAPPNAARDWVVYE